MEVDSVILDFFHNAILNPSFIWAENERQRKKFEKRVGNLLSESGLTPIDLAKVCKVKAESRINGKVPTLFLNSFGSSGSHLFQHALSLSSSCIPLGEVYFPEALKSLFNDNSLNSRSRSICLEMYFLLHSTSMSYFLSDGVLINSAHRPRIEEFTSVSANSIKALIVRTLKDLVVSRTYRKAEYKKYLQFENDLDDEYLEYNIKRTTSFFNSIIKSNYDVVFHFEEFMSGSVDYFSSIRKRGFFERLSINPLVFNQNLSDSILNEATNKFKGVAQAPSEAQSRLIDSALANVQSKLDMYLREAK